MGRNGPNVEWIGLIVRTDDGQVHAVEMDGRGSRVTADLVINPYETRNDVFPITAIIKGVGRYWREGENLGPDVQPRRQLGLPPGPVVFDEAPQLPVGKKGVGDGTRG